MFIELFEKLNGVEIEEATKAEKVLQLLSSKWKDGVSWEDLSGEFGYSPGDDTSNLYVVINKLRDRGEVDRIQDPRSSRRKFIYFLLSDKSRVEKRLQKEADRLASQPKRKKEKISVGVDRGVVNQVEQVFKKFWGERPETPMNSFTKTFPTCSWDFKGKNKILADTISDYFHEDLDPIGKVGRYLEQAVQKAKGSVRDIILFRGIRVQEDLVLGWVEKIKEKGKLTISMRNPSSWTPFPGYASEFTTTTGYRRNLTKRVGVLFRVLASKGTKAVKVDRLGFTDEVLLSKSIKVGVAKIERYRTGYRVTGKFI